MRGLLADVNAEGHFHVLLAVCRSAAWRSVWEGLSLATYEFPDLGLDRRTPDLDVWKLCQDQQLVLVTGNRNAAGTTSLDTAIRTHSVSSSLPVITIADMKRLMKDRVYCDRSVERLLDILMDIDRYRGSGRLFLP
jgi:hypothetical protein